MRVLLLGITTIAPLAGGGYTLSQDLFQALSRNLNDGRHRFYLINSESENGASSDLPAAFSRISVKRKFLHRVIERLTYDAKSWFGSKTRGLRPALRALKRELAAQRVDCALNLDSRQFSPVLPNIVTVWDLEHRRKPYFPELTENDEWETRERHYRNVLSKAVAVITGTQVGKCEIERFYGVDPATINVIPFPTPSFALEYARTAQASIETLPAGVSGEFLFYPAQYWPHKNHLRLLQAVKILREQHGWDGMLVCCGSDKGNLKYLKEKAVNLGVENHVRFLGFVKRSELVALYQNALVLTFASYFGPDNLPPLEAFALGCPVIASAIEGAEEQLGAGALYANPDSASEIAEAVLRIKFETTLRERLIAEGRRRAMNFTADKYVDRLMELLDSLEPRFMCFRH